MCFVLLPYQKAESRSTDATYRLKLLLHLNIAYVVIRFGPILGQAVR